MTYLAYAIAAWPLIAVILVFAICRAIHNDKARAKGMGVFTA